MSGRGIHVRSSPIITAKIVTDTPMQHIPKQVVPQAMVRMRTLSLSRAAMGMSTRLTNSTTTAKVIRVCTAMNHDGMI